MKMGGLLPLWIREQKKVEKLWEELFPFLPNQLVRVKDSLPYKGMVGRILHKSGVYFAHRTYGVAYVVEFKTSNGGRHMSTFYAGELEHVKEEG